MPRSTLSSEVGQKGHDVSVGRVYEMDNRGVIIYTNFDAAFLGMKDHPFQFRGAVVAKHAGMEETTVHCSGGGMLID